MQFLLSFILLISFLNYSNAVMKSLGALKNLEETQLKFKNFSFSNTQIEHRQFEATNAAVKLTKVYPYFYTPMYKDILYMCPEKRYFPGLRCFYLKESAGESEAPTCDDVFQPSLVKQNKRCGNGGTWYSYQYEICQLPAKGSDTAEEDEQIIPPIKAKRGHHKEEDLEEYDFLTKPDAEDSEVVQDDRGRELTEVVESNKFYVLEVYAFCYKPERKRTLFTRHKISMHWPYDEDTVWSEASEIPSTNVLGVGSYEDFEDDLTLLRDIYDKEKQKPVLRKILKKDDITNEDPYLIPQYLTPKSHLSSDLSRGVHQHFVNVRPMWSSRLPDWRILRQVVLKKIYPNDVRKLILTIYTGAYGTLKVDEEPQYLTAADREVGIPKAWWMMVVEEKSETGIIIAMENNVIGSSEKTFCAESVCEKNSWFSIEPYGYCCEANEHILEGLKLSFISIPGGVLNLGTILRKTNQPKEED